MSIRNYFAPLAAALVVPAAALAQTAPPAPMILQVDATDVAQGIVHSHITIPVTGSAMSLDYPKWIPGEHAPSGPLDQIAGLHITADGKELAWRRDLVNMYQIHVPDIPAGTATLDVRFDLLSPSTTDGFGASNFATPAIFDLEWNQVILYPDGYTARQIMVDPSITLPMGWKFGTALPQSGAPSAANTVTFQPAMLYTVIDSPLISGTNFRRVPLTAPGQTPPEELDIVADEASDLDMPAKEIADYHNLVREGFALFGSRHFRDYHFVTTLSDYVAGFGLEHHESSDDRTDAGGFTDPHAMQGNAELLPHEYVHSWNGKYRRPADLATPEYETPEQTDLLWVYEGLTDYYGAVLSARAGLETAAAWRDRQAQNLAARGTQYGRTWRPLQDTADDAQDLYYAPREWESYRRGTDFYEEGQLIWLDADTTIRRLTHSQKSLDDFCKLFFGPDVPQLDAPVAHPYTFDQLVTAMNQIAPYDWATFWHQRLDGKSQAAPAGGINASGWKLIYNATPSTTGYRRGGNYLFTLGCEISGGQDGDGSAAGGGSVVDVNPGSPAFRAGMTPGMRIVAVNDHSYTSDRLTAAMSPDQASSGPIRLLVVQDDVYRTLSVDYHGGERYPHLVPIPGAPDILADILRPHAPPATPGQ